MTDSRQPKNFWTTLPGVLTGIASLLTAVVALLNFLNAGKTPKHPAPVLFAPQETGALLNRSECPEIVGSWNWFIGGVTEIQSDGSLIWKARDSDTVPTGVGQWTCLKGKPRKYQLAWQTGMADIVTLSEDQESLSGSNPVGARVSGSRRKASS